MNSVGGDCSEEIGVEVGGGFVGEEGGCGGVGHLQQSVVVRNSAQRLGHYVRLGTKRRPYQG